MKEMEALVFFASIRLCDYICISYEWLKLFYTVQAGWIFKIPPITGQIFFPTADPLITRFNLPPLPIFCPPQLHRNPSAKPLNYLSENTVGETLSLMAIRIMLVTSEWLTGAFVWRLIRKKKKNNNNKKSCVFWVFFSVCWFWYSSNYLYHKLKDASVW